MIVRCPICLDRFPWDEENGELFHLADGGFQRLRIPPGASPERRAAERRQALIRCPNPSGDGQAHFLPLLYAAYEPPIVIGLIGASGSGKTHLLAAMMGEIENEGLAAYGLKADALDAVRHRNFLSRHTRRLMDGGVRLERTADAVADFADALLISSAYGTWPVAFWDVGGEDLSRLQENTRFLSGVTALIFLVDPLTVASPRARDDTFRSVLGMLHPGGGYFDVPASVVVTKSDLVRFDAPVDDWIHRAPANRVDPAQILAESRDVYAYLHRADAGGLLQPYRYCRRCTLHFSSATGGDATERTFPNGVHPRRVLEPLVALLAMSGVLGPELAAEVGR